MTDDLVINPINDTSCLSSNHIFVMPVSLPGHAIVRVLLTLVKAYNSIFLQDRDVRVIGQPRLSNP